MQSLILIFGVDISMRTMKMMIFLLKKKKKDKRRHHAGSSSVDETEGVNHMRGAGAKNISHVQGRT